MSAPIAGENIRPVAFSDALGERYLAYALSTITSRSLPDVRDGLKPVQRRLLFAMQELKLDPASGYKKCARVVGDVIGKYHPHGDVAVYDAMVRLAQSFAVRWPLVEGHGNFGNIDGDNAAAMRYTEARLTDVAVALLEGIGEDAVEFRETYDGEEREPVVLPAAFPNLLANGANGIAVGLATSIPPHNAGELCAALEVLLKNSRCSVAELIACVPAPDFPTGGVLVEDPAAIAEAYTTGRGSFRVRARWQVEKIGRGQYQIVISEIPYQVQKARLVEKIAELLQSRKLALLADVRDESADDVRLVLEPRSRSVDPDMLMETMFRLTELESRISLNMNVLDAAGVPGVMNLKQVLRAFLDHRLDVLLRHTAHRLKHIAHRLEVLGGYLVAYLNLDEVIHIIREEDEPRPKLMKRFKITEVQAEAILNMRLRALRKLEEVEIRSQFEALSKEQAELKKLQGSKARQRTALGKEIKATKQRFGAATGLGRRRTEIGAPPEPVELPTEALVERGRSLGEPVRLMIELANDQDVVALFVHRPGRRLFVASSDGRGFVAEEDGVLAEKRTGKQVLNPGKQAEACICVPAEGDSVAVVGDNRRLLLFPAAELPVLTRGRGVILQRYRDGGLSDAKMFNKADGLSWRTGAGVRNEGAATDWWGKRSQAGRVAPRGFPKCNKFG